MQLLGNVTSRIPSRVAPKTALYPKAYGIPILSAQPTSNVAPVPSCSGKVIFVTFLNAAVPAVAVDAFSKKAKLSLIASSANLTLQQLHLLLLHRLLFHLV